MTERDPISHYEDMQTGTNWFVGIIVALALLAIGYLVFSAGDTSCIDQFACTTTIEATE
jgi:hypothetical protein